MKTLVQFIVCFFVLCQVFAQQSKPCGTWQKTIINADDWDCSDYEYGLWTLVFEDNFDGNTINTSNWFTCPEGWHRDHGDQLQYYLDENVILSNGILHLTAKHEPGYYPVYYFDSLGSHLQDKYFEYTSGWIETKMQLQYGLFEVRCKVPYGQGFWPAFWFYGNGGEIDVFEFNGENPNKPYMTIHNWLQGGTIHEWCTTHQSSTIDFSSDYHTFSLEWDEFKLLYRIDGDIVHVFYRYLNTLGVGMPSCESFTTGLYLESPFLPQNAQSMRLSFAISPDGGGVGGAHAPNNQTVFPSSFDIDYVKIYKRNNPDKVVHVCEFDSVTSNAQTADTIIFSNGCETNIATDKAAIAKANKEIILKSGFLAESGSTFHALINNQTSAATTLETPIYDSFTEDYIEQKKCLQKKSEEPSVLLYPSPNNGSFQLNIEKFAKGEDVDLEIKDIYGKTIYLQRISGSTVPIRIDCPSGQYFALLKCGGKTIVEKFVVIK